MLSRLLGLQPDDAPSEPMQVVSQEDQKAKIEQDRRHDEYTARLRSLDLERQLRTWHRR